MSVEKQEENNDSPKSPESPQAADDQEQQEFEHKKTELLKRCETVLGNLERYRGVTSAKRRWYKIIGGLRAVIKLNRICKDIKTYGTSEELLNVKSRSKKAIAQAIDPSLERYIKPEVVEELPCGIIHPYGKFMKYWSIVLFLLFCYVGMIMPVKMVFVDDDLAWTLIDLMIDLLFLGDVGVCCSMAFYDSNENLVTSRRTIMLEYLKGWLVLDLAAAFPNCLLDLMTSYTSDMLASMQIPKFYKLLKVARLFKMYKIASKGGFFESLQDYLRMNTGITRLISFSATVMLCNHIAGCMWVYIAKIDNNSPDTWIARCGFQDAGGVSLYLAGLYWSYQTLLTIGYGDIPPYTTAELSICICWMIFGAGVFSMSVGNLSSVLTSMDSGSNNLAFKLATLFEFCHDAKLDPEIRRKLKNAVEYSHRKNVFTWVDKQKIFDELPPHLKCEVAAKMYDGVINKLHFFNEKDGTFIALVVPLLQPLKTGPREIVFRKNDHPFCIFFLVEGRVSYLMHGTLPYKSMVTGSYFGEQEIIERTKRKYTVRSERNCDLLTLTKSIFSTVIGEEYDEIYSEMRTLAGQRKEKFHQAKIRMRKYLLAHKEKLIEDEQMTEVEINKYVETSDSEDENENEKGDQEEEEGSSFSSESEDGSSDSSGEVVASDKAIKEAADNALKVFGPKREQQSGEVVQS